METKKLLIQFSLLSLCPKASLQNIPEYVAMRDCLRRGAELGWPPAALLQTWVVLQGIRGKEGVEAATDVMGIGVPSWNVDAYWNIFCDRWERRYNAAVRSTGRVAVLGHEEGRASGMTGHHFVAALRSPAQRFLVKELARKCEVYLTQDFGPQEVLEVKRLINQSGLHLRLPKDSDEGVSLASPSGYNGMNWTRCFSLLMRDVHGASRCCFNTNLWDVMMRCQGGHDVREAQRIFGVENTEAANSVLAACPDLSWELLFVALCETRQAWQHFKDGGKEFTRIVNYVSKHPQSIKTIRRFTHNIVERGVQPHYCFSTRLFRALRKHIACKAKAQRNVDPNKSGASKSNGLSRGKEEVAADQGETAFDGVRV